MKWRGKLFRVIFGTESKAGRIFDIVLLWSIILSVLIVMLESLHSVRTLNPDLFQKLEWGFTILFTIEYLLRIISHPRPHKYIYSFWGIIDLLAFLPTYLSFFLIGSQYLLAIRILRLLRIFRILKLGKYLLEAEILVRALKASSYKITVFFGAVIAIVVVMGSLMYVVEGGRGGFQSIPHSIYWAIVTITTVGFGDIVPTTALGKIISSIMMITGYAIIAVPTGIVTVELSRDKRVDDKQKPDTIKKCPACGKNDHDNDAKHCKHCGEKLPDDT